MNGPLRCDWIHPGVRPPVAVADMYFMPDAHVGNWVVVPVCEAHLNRYLDAADNHPHKEPDLLVIQPDVLARNSA